MIYLISTIFCFSVDNQDDFYNELLLRRNAINEKIQTATITINYAIKAVNTVSRN